jgi:hypothetical protein
VRCVADQRTNKGLGVETSIKFSTTETGGGAASVRSVTFWDRRPSPFYSTCLGCRGAIGNEG